MARSLAKGRVEIVVDVDRARDHPLARHLAELEPVRDLGKELGLEPLRDLRRAFLTADTTASDARWIAVLEHRLPHARARAALGLLARSTTDGGPSDGAEPPSPLLADDPFTVRVDVGGMSRVVSLVAPGVLAVVPPEQAPSARRFVGTGGCPATGSDEVLVATAFDPAESLAGSDISLPPTISLASLRLWLTADGGAEIELAADSRNAADAPAAAEALAALVAKHLSFQLGAARVCLLDPLAPRVDGARASARTHLSRSELGLLVGAVRFELEGVTPSSIMSWLGDASRDLVGTLAEAVGHGRGE